MQAFIQSQIRLLFDEQKRRNDDNRLGEITTQYKKS